MPEQQKHYSGYVNIIGRPNVGKSTLMNALLGEKMSIITPKAQTTRHRILGILNEPEFQIIFSDTPGIVHDPKYKMHKAMNAAAYSIFEDADTVLLMVEPSEPVELSEKLEQSLKRFEVPIILIINKIDLSSPEDLKTLIDQWGEQYPFHQIIPISATEKSGLEFLMEKIKGFLPEGPPYFPKDQLSDKPERFFVSEIVREKIFLLYKQEIPYSSEVIIEEFKTEERETGPFVRIKATIFVLRKTQKSILIGKGGSSIKKLGIQARKDIEKFLEARVHLELYVKVKEKWRDDDRLLKSFGYLH